PGPYTFGDIVVVTGTPERWAGFQQWSDGSRENPRGITIGVSNRYTANFTNTLPLERWTNQLTGQSWEVPEGTPRIYVNGSLTFGGTFLVADTNAPVVRMESSFDSDGVILYTTDGSDPIVEGLPYLSQFPVTEPATVRAIAVEILTEAVREADPVTIGFLPTLRGWTRGGGDVRIEPDGATYERDTRVTLTATPSNGWVFLHWAGDANDTNSVIEATMDRGKTIEAVFGTFLTTGPFGGVGGTIIREPPDGPYPFGLVVRLSAVPQTGRYFDQWFGPTVGGRTDSPLAFTITNANPTATALFRLLPANTFALTVRLQGEGAVFRSPALGYYTNGATVWLTNVPAPAQSFIGWSGDASGVQNPLPVLMNANKTIVARFVSTIAPLVEMDSPTNLAAFGAPADILVGARASDSDGSVVRVDFLAGASVVATRTQPPFSAVWTNVGVGNYQVAAVAYDNSGLVTTSAPVVVIVNPPARFRLGQTRYDVDESQGAVDVSIVNDGLQGGRVNYALVAISAVGGLNGAGDFEYRQGSLEFTNGERAKIISIGIHDDYIPEGDESFEVRLSNPSPGASVGSPAAAQVTIHDNDGSALTNSLLDLRFPEPAPSLSGRLIVRTLPEEAGGRWRFPGELAWRAPVSSTEPVSLAVGNYDLEFLPLTGWELAARTMQVTILSNRTIEVVNEYYRFGNSPRGSLTVSFGPPDPELINNAGWQLAEDASAGWLPSGATATNLSVGLHVVRFRTVRGWFTPAPVPVEVFEGTSTPPLTNSYLIAEPLPDGVRLPVPLTRQEINDGLSIDDPQLPFALCGQLRSEAGYGSGVAVREQVVLTAAHLVFDSFNLTEVEDLNWFFQKNDDGLDSRPLRPRGWHILAGYAAARTNDLLVNVKPWESSLNSRIRDVAALFFWEPAARKGQSGYLTSDAGTNQWLLSALPKLLVGYPMDAGSTGYGELQPGRMHATRAENYLFSPESSQVYRSSGLLSFPGNSGGPLCVRFEHQRDFLPHYTYYPAAIYLGTVGGASVVRSIDGEVVSLILSASDSAETGKNSNGGVFPFGAPGLAGLKIGYLQVTLQPPCAVNAGAWWWVEGDTNRFTNSTVAALEYSYTIRFAGVPGFAAPAQERVTLVDKRTNSVVARYQPVQGASLQVIIQPAEAIAAGARWFIVGDSNRWSSEQVLSLGPCEQLVGFASATGFETPPLETVMLTYGRTNVLVLTYPRQRPVLRLTDAEGLRLNGTRNRTYEIHSTTNLSPTSSWSNFFTITLSNDSQLIPGTAPIPTNGNRYYRGILKP
ncbi:MAG TPA: Ig-like domain-containing protein, partial [Verrucomicrobiae bacterium]|nr:Ig-like domain-containing protein [Verrucomicrobiae bacterium]